jgi:hypothetical protein
MVELRRIEVIDEILLTTEQQHVHVQRTELCQKPGKKKQLLEALWSPISRCLPPSSKSASTYNTLMRKCAPNAVSVHTNAAMTSLRTIRCWREQLINSVKSADAVTVEEEGEQLSD